MAVTVKSSRKRLDREAWLDGGLSALTAEGPEALKLEAICARLGVTRGSFYHHFADHTAFLIELIELWEHRQTEQVVPDGDAWMQDEDAVEAVMESARAIDFRLELGIREIARRHPEVLPRIQQTDRRRLGLLQRFYEVTQGVEPSVAHDLATLDYAVFAGLMLLDPDRSADDVKRLEVLYHAMAERFAKSF